MDFYKYQATGNDFIVVDEREGAILAPSFVPRLASRRYGIGADGVLLIQNSGIADAKMVYYNADGSRASMCLNGLRTLFFHLEGVTSIETDCGVYEGKGNTVFLPAGKVIEAHVTLQDLNIHASLYDTGVPHLIVENEIEDVEVEVLGKKLAHHAMFPKAGVNVDFVKKLDASSLVMRTYERGVEAETLSCGTGAYAAFLWLGASEGTIYFHHNESLKFARVGEQFSMQGRVMQIFSRHC